MKIAFFTDTFTPQINGVTKTLDRLKNYLDEKKIEYIFFAPENHEYDNISENNVCRLFSINFFMYPELKFAIPNMIKIKKQLHKFKPDLIHVITPFNIGLSGLIYARRNNIPLVASFHTNFHNYLNYYNLKFLEKPLLGFLRWFHNQASVNYCPSRGTFEELKKKEIDNLQIWGRGIDKNKYSPDYYDSSIIKKYNLDNKIVLLYVGRIAPEKNLELLIKSIKILNKKYHDKISLLITGSGPSLKEMKKMAPDNVLFTGYLKGKRLSSIYATSDIFVFPSITETYGNVILEAMSSGLPVVGINQGGVKENLIEGLNGLACQKNNLLCFSTKIERLINDGELRQKLSKNARQYAINKSWKAELSNLILSYYEVIEKHKYKSQIKSA